MEIIAKMAKDRMVETMIQNIVKKGSLSADMRDLSQMVYLVLLEYNADKIVELWTSGEIRFFVARIILNQLNSKSSPFYRSVRKLSSRAVELGDLQERLPDA